MPIHVWYSIVAVAAVVALFLLASFASTSFAGSSNLLVALLALHAPQLLRSIRLYISPADRAPTRMPPRHCLYDQIHWSVRSVPLLILLVCTHGTLWSFSGIGISMQLPPTVCIAIGLVISVVFNACLQWPSDRSSVHSADVKRTVATLRMHLPRGTLAQLVSGYRCVYSSPLFEELVYRGFFVFYFAQLASSAFLAIFVGWLLCVWLHLYQGTGRILPVTIFYAISTGLLFSPVGLLGAIGFHSGCNLDYVLQLRDMSERYLLRRRSKTNRHAEGSLSYCRKLQVACGLLVVTVLLEWLPFQSPPTDLV